MDLLNYMLTFLWGKKEHLCHILVFNFHCKYWVSSDTKVKPYNTESRKPRQQKKPHRTTSSNVKMCCQLSPTRFLCLALLVMTFLILILFCVWTSPKTNYHFSFSLLVLILLRAAPEIKCLGECERVIETSYWLLVEC